MDGVLILAGVIVTGIFTLTGLRIAAGFERAHRLRAARIEAYAEFTSELDAAFGRINRATVGVHSNGPVNWERHAAGTLELMKHIEDGLSLTTSAPAAVLILGPKEVTTTADAWARSLAQYVGYVINWNRQLSAELRAADGGAVTKKAAPSPTEFGKCRFAFLDAARVAVGTDDKLNSLAKARTEFRRVAGRARRTVSRVVAGKPRDKQ